MFFKFTSKFLYIILFFLITLSLLTFIIYLKQNKLPKIIWIYWEQSWESAPEICKKCLKSWKKYNKNWKIYVLSKNNLHKYIDMNSYVHDFWNKEPIQSRSDLIRINLLNIYGGVWTDATVFCTKPLDTWIHEAINFSGFFAFDKPGSDRLLSSWFLAGYKNNYIINKWCKKYNNYWINLTKADEYFKFHYIFNELYEKDKVFQNLWDKSYKISADIPHKLKIKDRYSKPNEDIKQHIINLESPMYKLDHNVNTDKELINDNVYSFLIKYHLKNL